MDKSNIELFDYMMHRQDKKILKYHSADENLYEGKVKNSSKLILETVKQLCKRIRSFFSAKHLLIILILYTVYINCPKGLKSK